MDYKKYLDSKKVIFFLGFVFFVLLGSQINVFNILGADSHFTLVQFFAPVAGGFLGPVFGSVAIAVSEAIRAVFTQTVEFANLVTLVTMTAAAIAFSIKDWKFKVAVPSLAMIAFWLNPNTSGAWFYALYWLVPIVLAFKFRENLFARSLSATFTAHAIGSIAYLYAFSIPADVWIKLIPIVAYERALFALGISISYIVVNFALSWFEDFVPSDFVALNPRYSKRLVLSLVGAKTREE